MASFAESVTDRFASFGRSSINPDLPGSPSPKMIAELALLPVDNAQSPPKNVFAAERVPSQRKLMNIHYDVIIIGTGAGGGTLAYRLAPSLKSILLIERGGWLKREPEN